MTDETPKPYTPKIDRRTALIWVGAVGAATAVGGGVVIWRNHIGDKEAAGYGTDPKLNPPIKAPWPRLLSEDELHTAALLADFVLPASAGAPSASAIGVPDFINEWVSAPYPDQLKDRPIIRGGLKAIENDVLRGDGPTRASTLAGLPHAEDEKTRTFFRRFRALTVGAYYTTEAGFKDIGFIGNQARPSDPGPSEEVKYVLEQRLAELGL